MEITAVAYDASESLASLALRQERKEDAGRLQSAQAYDTVSISPEARALAQVGRGDEAGGNAEDASTAEDRPAHNREASNNNVGTGVARGGDGSSSDDSTVESLQQQIREAEQKLAEAQEELNQAMSEGGGAPRTARQGDAEPAARNPDAENAEDAEGAVVAAQSFPQAAEAAPADNGRVKMLQMKVSSLNTELMELRQALQEATRASG